MSDTNLKESFSQETEDLFLAQQFPDKFSGFFVDIGAHHPTRFSNTALFYKKGWRGINVEANESIIPEFNKERLNDINLHFLVSDKCKKSTFYEFSDPALNTAKKVRVEFLKKNTNYSLLRENSMRCVSLNYILKRYLPKKQKMAFSKYAQVYDVLNQSKDYFSEAKYLSKLLRKKKLSGRRILEFGAGTGKHAEILENLVLMSSELKEVEP